MFYFYHSHLPGITESLFIVAGPEITVNKLSKEYQDVIIKCLAVQEYLQYDATVVEEHEIRLDVWCKLPVDFFTHVLK